MTIGTAPPLSPDGSATELRDRLAAGMSSAEEVTTACLARIDARESQIGAWAWLDPGRALDEARRLDADRAQGKPLGGLHGVPVGVKDIVDTAGIPTGNGCALDEGRVPRRDAVVVERLRAAGAVILGKTVTTELAYLHPAATRNPRDPAHTPGGSSAGSAAAVACGMVPLAIGTQTGGSVIRPASFCGIVGFKPTFGAIPRSGVLMQSPTLDTVGVFAADLAGAALLAEALFGHDAGDPATCPAPRPRLLAATEAKPPVPPLLAVVRPPGWDDADPDMRAAFDALVAALGGRAVAVDLPERFDEAAAMRERINLAEMAHHYRRYGGDAARLLGAETRDALARGAAITALDYLRARDLRDILAAELDAIFAGADAILCPAATGAAPAGLASTGSAIFNGLWTLAGTPAVTLPLLTAANGLPIGAQLVGARGDDARLLRTAAWLDRWHEGMERAA